MKLSTAFSCFAAINALDSGSGERELVNLLWVQFSYFQLDNRWHLDTENSHSTSVGPFYDALKETLTTQGYQPIRAPINQDETGNMIRVWYDTKHGKAGMTVDIKPDLPYPIVKFQCPTYVRCDLDKNSYDPITNEAFLIVAFREVDLHNNKLTFPKNYISPEVAIIADTLDPIITGEDVHRHVSLMKAWPLDGKLNELKYIGQRYLMDDVSGEPHWDTKSLFHDGFHLQYSWVFLKDSNPDSEEQCYKVWGTSEHPTHELTLSDLSDCTRLNGDSRSPYFVFNYYPRPTRDLVLAGEFDFSQVADLLNSEPIVFLEGILTSDMDSTNKNWFEHQPGNDDVFVVTGTHTKFRGSVSSELYRKLRFGAKFTFKGDNNAEETVTVHFGANSANHVPCQIHVETESSGLSKKFRALGHVISDSAESCDYKVTWVYDESATGHSTNNYYHPALYGEVGKELVEEECPSLEYV